MSEISHAMPSSKPEAHAYSAGVFFRSVVIALTAFLTLVDLFATQAILPMLTAHYGVTPGQMGLASRSASSCCRFRRRSLPTRLISLSSHCCA